MIGIILASLALFIVIDFISGLAIGHVFRIKRKPFSKKWFKRIYFFFSFATVLTLLIYFISIRFSDKPDYIIYRHYFFLTGIFFSIYLPKVILLFIFLAELLIRTPFLILKKRGLDKKAILFFSSFNFLSGMGLLLTIGIMLIVLHGMIVGRTAYKIENVTVEFTDLPPAFDGMRVALISDMHLGSFSDSLDVGKGIKLMMQENPDIIFFTGDLVNNEAAEAEYMLNELTRMHAPSGMYSILGNHDVGDYRRWKTIDEKNTNLELLVSLEEKAGFNLLIDENIILKKGNDSIAIIGVNSWGLPPFKEYGHLDKAMLGVENVPFKILLTHNPVHWEQKVSGKENIQLSLSGHTHAMQFGIDCGGIFWSPVKTIYKHWAGLYYENEQYLYVNRGFGYLGFPGRIGMKPEITIIEFKRKR